MNRIILTKILRYFVIMLVPITIVCVFVFTNIFQNFENSVISYNQSLLNNIQFEIEDDINKLLDIRIQLNEQIKFIESDLKNAYDGLEIIDLLGDLYLTVPYAHTLAYYPYESDYIFTHETSSTFDNFFDNLYIYDNLDKETIKKSFESNFTSYAFPVSSIESFAITGDFITMVLPLTNNEGTFFALIPESFILNRFANHTNDVIVLNNFNETLLTTIDGFTFNEKLMNNDNSIDINGKPYFITNTTYRDLGWNFYSLSEQEATLNIINQSVISFVILLVIILVGVSYLIVVLSAKEYHPLVKLLNKVDNYIDDESSQKLNEYSKIDSVIDYLNRVNQVLSRKYLNDSPLLISQKISVLLSGEYTNLEVVVNELEDFSICFTHSNYYVITLKINSLKEVSTKDVFESVKKQFSNCLVEAAYTVNPVVKSYIINFDGNLDIHNQFEILCDTLKQMDVGCTLGISRKFHQLDEAYLAYEQSLSALDYYIILEPNIPIYFSDYSKEEAVKNQIDATYTQNLLSKLLSELENNNQNNINVLIDKFFENIQESRSPIYQVKLYCYKIIQVLTDYVHTNTENPDVYFDYIASMQNFTNIFVLKDTITDLCSFVCEISLGAKKKNDLISEIYEIMKKEYADVNFSINVLSQKFDMSVSNLSHYFKRNSGETFTIALDNIRVNKAIELIDSTDLTIKDIALKVGYFSIGTFQRKFKAITGTTPGFYNKEKTSKTKSL